MNPHFLVPIATCKYLSETYLSGSTLEDLSFSCASYEAKPLGRDESVKFKDQGPNVIPLHVHTSSFSVSVSPRKQLRK